MADKVFTPLAPNVPIVDARGNPTPYFQRILQELSNARISASLIDALGGDPDENAVVTWDDTANDLAFVPNDELLELDDLTDVDVSTTPPDDGQALIWDDANSEWIPGDVAGGGGGDLGVFNLVDQRASGVDGGTFTSGAWQPRVLNTVVSNSISGATHIAANVTITIASPGVVTWNAHGLVNGTPVIFTTTGALPTGLTAGTVYFVVSSAANTFSVSATSGGSAINTSGTQSGTHTGTSNQFTLDAGTYDIFITTPGHQVETHQCRLQNLTDATTAATGSTARTRATSATDGSSDSTLRARITIGATKRFEVQHRCSSTFASAGMGVGSANTWGIVIHAAIFIRQVSVATPVTGTDEVLLGTATLSGAASLTVLFDSSLVTTAYKLYKIVFHSLVGSASTTVGLQFSPDNGATWRTTGYTSTCNIYQVNSTSVNKSNPFTTAVPLTPETNSDASYPAFGELWIQDPANTGTKTMTFGRGQFKANDNNRYEFHEAGNYDTTEAHNAMRIVLSSGTISGVCKLYGIP